MVKIKLCLGKHQPDIGGRCKSEGNLDSSGLAPVLMGSISLATVFS